MLEAPTPDDETARLDALARTGLLEGQPDPVFDELVTLARQLTGVETVLISLVDADRQWFKAKVGLEAEQTPRSISFCAHAILTPFELTWVEDASTDPRFYDNPLVLGSPNIRFYAGVPLVIDGQPIGTLCLIDPAPRVMNTAHAEALRALSTLVVARIKQQRTESRLAHLAQASIDAIICAGPDHRITVWNSAAERIFGHSAEDALGSSLSLIVPERLRPAHEAGFSRFLSTGENRLSGAVELRGKRANGTEVDIELTIATWREGARPHCAGIVRDISSRKAAEAALLQAKKEAEAANVAKTMFLANMSHEIRTPLNGVLAVADVLSATPLTPKQSEMADLIRTSGQQLHALLGDVLELSRIESGRLELISEPFCLGAALESVAELLRVRAQDKGLEVLVLIAAETYRQVQGDQVRLKQIVTNLLSNAIKFTPKGQITLRAERLADEWVISVKDTGVGFDVAQLERLFSPFEQADGSVTRHFGGSGLGLAITRELVQAMAGTISAHASPGSGAEFVVTLPLPTAENEPAEAAAFRPDVLPASALRVLLADDNETNRRIVELLLSDFEIELTSVDDGAKAVACFQQHRFDLVLMDMMMPVMDGLNATRAIRAHEECSGEPRTPILMLTANAMAEHVRAALDAGADIHVPKPLTANSLLEAVSKALTADASEAAA